MPESDVLRPEWRKARRSMSNGACVEVASTLASVMVRDSVDPAGPAVRYPSRTWQVFIAATKASTYNFRR